MRPQPRRRLINSEMIRGRVVLASTIFARTFAPAIVRCHIVLSLCALIRHRTSVRLNTGSQSAVINNKLAGGGAVTPGSVVALIVPRQWREDARGGRRRTTCTTTRVFLLVATNYTPKTGRGGSTYSTAAASRRLLFYHRIYRACPVAQVLLGQLRAPLLRPGVITRNTRRISRDPSRALINLIN